MGFRCANAVQTLFRVLKLMPIDVRSVKALIGFALSIGTRFYSSHFFYNAPFSRRCDEYMVSSYPFADCEN